VTQGVSAATHDAEVAPCVIAPGNHDGVHLGHRALIRRARSFAQAHGLETRALTFDPHPAAVLDGSRAKEVLTGQPRRAELLCGAGADRVRVQRFTPEFAALSPEAFVGTLLAQGARGLVVGPDFRFGCMRGGDAALLQRLGAREGFEVMIEPAVLFDGERVSSSAIRTALRAGDVAHASQLLGRLHEMQGRVVHGQERGRTLGFPTANLDPELVLPPLDGVYAVQVRELDSAQAPLLQGVANLGTRPTFAAGRSLEVHLFDFDRDIYDRELRVGFVARVRGEQRFSGVEALRIQISRDCDVARAVLQSSAKELTAWL
jgi:riboflavin kinase/FMN adenylyltransferase